MSELKAVHAFDVYEAYTKTGDDDAAQVYLKSEADKVMAEKDKEIERLEILCSNYRHDCDNLAISNEQAKRAARTLIKKMNHNKYKLCLAMAKWCESENYTACWYHENSERCEWTENVTSVGWNLPRNSNQTQPPSRAKENNDKIRKKETSNHRMLQVRW